MGAPSETSAGVVADENPGLATFDGMGPAVGSNATVSDYMSSGWRGNKNWELSKPPKGSKVTLLWSVVRTITSLQYCTFVDFFTIT